MRYDAAQINRFDLTRYPDYRGDFPPDVYQLVCGDVGRQKTEEAMAAIAAMGERFSETKADALVVVADDHLNAFSFNCVPAMCVRIGREVQRMTQDHAEAFDAVLEHMPLK